MERCRSVNDENGMLGQERKKCEGFGKSILKIGIM